MEGISYSEHGTAKNKIDTGSIKKGKEVAGIRYRYRQFRHDILETALTHGDALSTGFAIPLP